MKFGSVCSGIEAASVAWQPIGWKATWLSEIEPFPSAVLKHHYPDVPNLGDMTKLPDRIASGEIEAPDLLCGGTPCQAFSVAGKRESLDDERGNLSLIFCEIANAIDTRRIATGMAPAIIFWENVPGVLSTKDNAFGCFLGELSGETTALEPPGGKWTNAGCVSGPKRTIAWRILDAQYFGVAQRRRRVFVVASARNDFDPAAVLFEFEGVRRDTAPRRETGQNAVKCLTAGAAQRLDFETEDFVTQPIAWDEELNPSIDLDGTLIKGGDGGRHAGVAQPIAFPANLSGTQHASSEDVAPSMGAKNPTAVAQPFGGMSPVAGTLTANTGGMTRPAGNANELDFCVPVQQMAVRRLTPVECERLQGFPDNYTNIPWRKAAEAPDGPRYKALGNSWAVPVVRWIGKRIDEAVKC